MVKLKTLFVATSLATKLIFFPSELHICDAGWWQDYQEKCRRDTERTKQDGRKLKKEYNNFSNKVNGPNMQERAKDIAGKILENQYGIPQAREMIEIIDKGPNYNIEQRAKQKYFPRQRR